MKVCASALVVGVNGTDAFKAASWRGDTSSGVNAVAADVADDDDDDDAGGGTAGERSAGTGTGLARGGAPTAAVSTPSSPLLEAAVAATGAAVAACRFRRHGNREGRGCCSLTAALLLLAALAAAAPSAARAEAPAPMEKKCSTGGLRRKRLYYVRALPSLSEERGLGEGG